ncbi:MAG TPA: aquaporin [Gemmatimonadales bacterium]|nr:aquaporin [Gemmatimonadales bacterium]
MAKYLTEFLGTFFLILTIGLSVLIEAPMPALAIGGVLMVMVYMGGHISGAHYNPAVSLALLLRGKLPASEFVPYVIAQVAGSIVAMFTVNAILGKTLAPAPGDGIGPMAALLVEILFTFALALVVLNSAATDKTKGNSFYGLAIGFTLLVAAMAGGPISGGAFNPAVGIGPTIVHALVGGGTWSHLWLYIVGPLVGGALAALVFGLQEDVA